MLARLQSATAQLRRLAPAAFWTSLAVILALYSLWLLDAWQRPVFITFGLLTTLPLALTWRSPVAVWATIAAGAVLASIAGVPATPTEFTAGLVALFVLTQRHSRLRSGLIAGVFALGTAFVRRQVNGFELAFELAIVALNWLLAGSVRTQRALVNALEERARSQEQIRAEEMRRAAAEERARIARELHDIVAHSLGVIVVQATAGGRVVDESPEEARAALNAVERTGRDALADMRRLLGVLREDGPSARQPQPGLDQLEPLLERFRAAGLDLAVEIDRPLPPLPAGLDLCAYRVLQEALTNCLKHAPGRPARLQLRCREGALNLNVSNDGDPSPAWRVENDGGHGLLGMRERVAMFGGDFQAGPAPDGGWYVAARLPLTAVA
ncbi:MAG: two-component sensor histidine kinase [Candidatus Dormibacteraeota bacterium]|uniref:histidine kinase n=1 Tax=Candidatus Dormiibacter inghamiae TaxID=3127013 RepID=A0A934KEH1_9BACT|nr:two-component sensor histidine kinase [Candidatus Dormibacteraeota bacterium]MBJ7605609.1 two-component sensor histidine kinase [Candidatus Dormibacteraeota bacterium]